MRLALSCAVLLALSTASPHAAAVAQADKVRSSQFEDIPADVLTDGFLEAHPDLKYRRAGTADDADGHFEAARKQYEHAARYGDKPSQARLGEMYWKGEGGKQDRVTGFLFMALAAERDYKEFETWKMYYWGQMTDAEKQAAAARDKRMLAEYGDAVAKPRQAKVMRREMHKATGSMLGPGSGAALYIALPDGKSVNAERFYARQFWNQQDYWKMQDKLWGGVMPGKVRVGDVENVPAADGAKPQGDTHAGH